MDELKELKRLIARQDVQLKKIQRAEARYKVRCSVAQDDLIAFWRDLWESGGLLFRGSKWSFRYVDLLIKNKDYEEALNILDRITGYDEKVSTYKAKIYKKLK